MPTPPVCGALAWSMLCRLWSPPLHACSVLLLGEAHLAMMRESSGKQDVRSSATKRSFPSVSVADTLAKQPRRNLSPTLDILDAQVASLTQQVLSLPDEDVGLDSDALHADNDFEVDLVSGSAKCGSDAISEQESVASTPPDMQGFEGPRHTNR